MLFPLFDVKNGLFLAPKFLDVRPKENKVGFFALQSLFDLDHLVLDCSILIWGCQSPGMIENNQF